jgi:hypothetical protein
MKSLLTLFVAATLPLLANARNYPATTHQSLSLLENKGQIRDQYGGVRNDIQYVLPAPGINIFVGNAQIHYQFTRTEVLNHNQPGTYIPPEKRWDKDVDRYEAPMNANIHTYRLDVELIGANASATAYAAGAQNYYENYYLAHCPLTGIRAHAWSRVTYRNVYPDIDWVIFVNGNKLEHEFVVGPDGDASLIRLRYKGHKKLSVSAGGDLVAETPMGTITEKAPVCYHADGTLAKSSFRLNGDVLSYDLGGVKNKVLIDPELIWGTYYGPAASNTQFYDVAVFDSAGLYGTGLTYAGDAGTIATIGSFQYTFGGFTDAYLVKFDTAGIRQWATYYGGTDSDYGTGVACDINGRIYITGQTLSPTAIATPGAQQTAYGGGPSDGFLAKFLPDGSRIWGTYIGGPGANYPWRVSCDLSGLVYVSGDTNESTGIATPGATQPAIGGYFDWYLIQYDSVGVRNWGTYIGGAGAEFNGSSCNDGYTAYVTGWTNSTNGIATAFAHQTTLSGPQDAALVKIFSNGAKGWGTYVGGANSEQAGGVACDKFRNIYLFGVTASDDAIASPDGFKTTRQGTIDAFLMKFHPEVGFKMWGTYFGGPNQETAGLSRIACDDSANVYVVGHTESTTGIASDTGAWQNTFGGGWNDGFLAKFNTIGQQKWSTYIGGNRFDEPRSAACLGDAVFIAGRTSSPDSIATPGGFQPTGGGGGEFDYLGFIEKFSDPDTSSIPEDTTVVPPVGLNNQHDAAYESALQLMPNPNKGLFFLQGIVGNRTGIAHFTITDVAGRTIAVGKTATHDGKVNEQISTGDIPTGMYFVRFVSPEGIEQVMKFRRD